MTVLISKFRQFKFIVAFPHASLNLPNSFGFSKLLHKMQQNKTQKECGSHGVKVDVHLEQNHFVIRSTAF